MKRVDIKIGFRCNNHCLFCVQGDKRDREKDLSLNEIKKRIKESANKGYNEIVFTGGEPTFRPKILLDSVSYAKDLGYEIIQIQTNGRMLSYLKFCEELIKRGATEFSPAIHGSTPEIHDHLTQSKGSWAQVVKGMKNLKRLNQEIKTNTVVVRQNYKDIPNIAELLNILGIEQYQFAFIHINHIILKDKEKIKEIVPRISKTVPYIKKGLDIAKKNNIFAMVEAVPYCLLKGYENYVSDRFIPKEVLVYDGEAITPDHSHYRKTEGKSRGPQCKKCKHYDYCEGSWVEYPQIFGWSEFKPVLD